MKKKYEIHCIAFLVLASFIFPGQTIFAQNCEPYLGQPTPDTLATLFPPANLQANNSWFWHGAPAFSPDGQEMFWVKYVQAGPRTEIWSTKCVDGVWSEPQLAPFSGVYSDNNPKFFHSSDTLYFQSERPTARIYKVVRSNNVWTSPVIVNLTIPSGLYLGKQFSIANNGNIYAELDNSQGTNSDIYCWSLINGQYGEPEKIDEICSPAYDGFPTIAGNEHFILYSSNIREGNFDIYISYRKADETWTEPVNLSIGTTIAGAAGWSYISPDNHYLFFTKSDALGFNPYWIKAKFIYDSSPKLPYMGQTPPTTTPRRFGPASLQSNGVWWWRTASIFSPDGKEMFFAKYHDNLTTGNHKLYFVEDINGVWTEPSQPSFASDSDDFSPSYSKNGDTLYFTSNRDGSMKAYFVVRELNGWSAPQLLNIDYESLPGDFSWDISMARNGNIYFTVAENNQSDIYMSVPQSGQYSTFEKLPDEINTSVQDNSAYIDPDEKFLIFASTRNGGFGFHDLYISLRKSDGSWTTAQNMGSPINASYEDAMPTISPDGKYLFFTSARSGDYGYNNYWVDASVVYDLIPKEPYLGQTPPGLTPEVFAPGIISTPGVTEFSLTFSSDSTDMFFYRIENNYCTLYNCKFENGAWTEPAEADFSAGQPALEPCFTVDNQSLYFIWNYEGYYKVERTESGWTDPIFAGQGMWLSTDAGGQLYTTDMSSASTTGKTYLAKITTENGIFTNYERIYMQPGYGNQAHPCIAPDSSYMLYDVEGGEYLYVSFKKPDGTWSTAIDLTDHGFDANAGGAYLTPDGNYLFYHLNGDIWWVDANIIKNLNPYVGVKEQSEGSIKLFQNEPNPCGANTKIAFELGAPSRITIEIFDQMGNKVFCLVKNKTFSTGKHEINTDVSNLPEGIYTYQLTTEKGCSMAKKILIF